MWTDAESGGFRRTYVPALGEHLSEDAAQCANATYANRVDNPEAYNFCIVADAGSDGIVFVALAVLFSCVLSKGKLTMLLVLLTGIAMELVVFNFNTSELGNSFSLWLGIQPADIFLYVFLPALLLESSSRLDFFLFKKLIVQIMTLAFLCVIINTVLMTPILLHVFGLSAHGWQWQHAVLFSVMVASTDAVSVSAVLHSAGAPEALVVLLEGESLFNDATSIVLFEIFFEKVIQIDTGAVSDSDLLSELPAIGWQIVVLSGGGIAVGLFFGYATQALLRGLRRGGLEPKSEILLVLGMAYMCFFVANSPLGVSGVIAVVVMGLQGSSCGKWDMSAKILETGQFDHFWDIISFAMNGIVFFFAGVASLNFMLRSGGVIYSLGFWPLLQFFSLTPAIYLAIFLVRIVGMMMVKPILSLLGSPLNMKNILFSTAGGLRGALCLILVQNMIQSNIQLGQLPKEVLVVRGEMALWASGYVIMTLLINAPLLGSVLSALKLTEITPSRKLMREKAKRALLRFTKEAISQLRDDNDEMLRGTDWDAVQEYVLGPEAMGPLSQSPSVDSQGAGFRTHEARSRGYERPATDSPVHADLEEPLLEPPEGAEQKTVYGMMQPPSSAAMPRAELMGDDDTVDDSEAVFHAFRPTGKMTPQEVGTALWEQQSPEGPAEELAEELPAGSDYCSISFSGTSDEVVPRGETDAQLPAGAMMGSRSASRSLLSHRSQRKSSKNLRESRGSMDSGNALPLPDPVFEEEEEEEDGLDSSTSGNETGPSLSKRVAGFFSRYSEQSMAETSEATDGEGKRARDEEIGGAPRPEAMLGQQNWTGLAWDLQRTVSITPARMVAQAAGQEGAAGEKSEEMLPETRIRLMMGLKRYFQAKRKEGLLSAHGLRILYEAVDLSLDRPERRLQIWKVVEKEVCGRIYTYVMARSLYVLRGFQLVKYKVPYVHDAVQRYVVSPLMRLINWRLSYTMTLACEVAIEYWLGLRHSPNAAWLASSAPSFQEEVEDEMDKVWQFIIDREVEAPERFKLVQSYRAAMAILRQQAFFLEKLFKSGMLDEGEMHHLGQEIQMRQNKLEDSGPGWKHPSLTQIVRGLPFFKNISEDAFAWIKKHAFLLRFSQGDVVLSSDNAGGGMYIVVTGLVESKYKQVMQGINNVWMVGTGGVVGLVASLTKQQVPGAADVVARGNPLGKGPVLMHFPQVMVDNIRKYAAEGSRQFKQLEINLFRLAALNYVERLRPLLVEQISQKMLANKQATERRRSTPASRRARGHWLKVKRKFVVEDEPYSESKGEHLTQSFKAAAELHFAAHQILDSICQDLHDGHLLDLKDGQSFTLTASSILLSGSVHGPFREDRPKAAMPIIRGPFVFVHYDEVLCPTRTFIAGPSGAVIVVASENEAHDHAASINLRGVIVPH